MRRSGGFIRSRHFSLCLCLRPPFFTINKNLMKFFIQFFVIIALITAGISPACAFINGSKNWIEICSADGDIKRIQVSENETPIPGSGDKSHNISLDECAFCMSHAFSKGALLNNSSWANIKPASYLKVSNGTAIPYSLKPDYFQARAPPYLS